MDSTGPNVHAARIPFEILEEILRCHDDADDLDTVLELSHVCKRWRAAALRQYVYAQRIIWSYHEDEHWSCRLPDATFLRDRLRTSAKPLEVDFFIRDSDPAFVFETLLPALSRELHRVRTLRVMSNRRAFPEFMRALVTPAPILRDLCVSCNSSADGTPELTSHIGQSMLFAGRAPLLRSLDLGGLELPSTPTAAFDAVTHIDLEFAIGQRWNMPHHLGLLCRSLKHLTLSISGEVQLDTSLLVSPSFPLFLDSLSLMYSFSPVTLISCLVSRDTTYIQSDAWQHPGLIPFLFGPEHLPPGMLHASYVRDKIIHTWADLRLHHPESGRHRSVVYDGLWTAYRFRHLLDAALPARIAELTVETGLFPMVASLFACLPALHTLVFIGSLSKSYFAGDDDDGEDSEDDDSEGDARGLEEAVDGSEEGTDSDSDSDSNSDVIGHQELPRVTATGLPYLSCSSLAKLILATPAGDPDVTRVDTLVTFMEAYSPLSRTARGAVELELRNATLSGDISPLSGFFSRVVTIPEPFEHPDLQGDRFKAS